MNNSPAQSSPQGGQQTLLPKAFAAGQSLMQNYQVQAVSPWQPQDTINPISLSSQKNPPPIKSH